MWTLFFSCVLDVDEGTSFLPWTKWAWVSFPLNARRHLLLLLSSLYNFLLHFFSSLHKLTFSYRSSSMHLPPSLCMYAKSNGKSISDFSKTDEISNHFLFLAVCSHACLFVCLCIVFFPHLGKRKTKSSSLCKERWTGQELREKKKGKENSNTTTEGEFSRTQTSSIVHSSAKRHRVSFLQRWGKKERERRSSGLPHFSSLSSPPCTVLALQCLSFA